MAWGGAESAATEAEETAFGSSKNGYYHRKAERKDHAWCWDFVFDRTTSGRPLKWLSIIGEYTRECLALKGDRSITSEDVIDTLPEFFAMQGVPRCIRRDNGPEFIAAAVRQLLQRVGVETLYVDPGAPWENGFAESFHSRLRDEFLAVEEFEVLRADRRLTGVWREDYNHSGRTTVWANSRRRRSRQA